MTFYCNNILQYNLPGLVPQFKLALDKTHQEASVEDSGCAARMPSVCLCPALGDGASVPASGGTQARNIDRIVKHP